MSVWYIGGRRGRDRMARDKILRHQPFSYLGGDSGIFHCARKFVFEPSSVNFFFLMRRKANICFPIMWNRIKNVLICCWFYATQIQQRNIFFFSYNAKSNFFFGQLRH